jgi:phosphatidylglycerophosphate synthase
MRKIPPHLENPIDNLIIETAHPTTTALRKLNMTPNGITTLSLIFGMLAVFFLALGRVWLAVILYAISYFFDNVDGYYARRYKMCSKGGDMYDHIKDWIVFGFFIVVFYLRNRHKLTTGRWVAIAGILIFFAVATWIQMSAQEAWHGKLNDSPTLNMFNFIKTKEQAESLLRVTRYFGCGSFILILLVIVLIVELK